MKTSLLKDTLNEILSDDKVVLNNQHKKVLITIRDKLDSDLKNEKKLSKIEIIDILTDILKIIEFGSEIFELLQ